MLLTPKLIITDLDRTLLKTDKSISAYTEDIFHMCNRAGIPIVFATARSPQHLGKILEAIPADGIIGNGGAIATFRGKRVYHATLDAHTANTIVTRAVERATNRHISFETDHAYHFNYTHSDWIKGFTSGFARPMDFNRPINEPVQKIAAECSYEAALEIISGMRDVSVMQLAGEAWLFISHTNATKWQAVKALAAFLDIDPKDIAVFGDDYNDVEMLANCGISVAVANAIPEAKAAAKFHCGGNDDDGVAKWIECNLF